MTTEFVSTTITIDASAAAVFAVLADPRKHASIDGTGRVEEPVDPRPMTAAGQVFAMAMYHPNHPNKNYTTYNQILDFEPGRVISWRTGYLKDDGELGFGGWFWRYDLTPVGPEQTEVTLTYDWSATDADVRERIQFPPFPPEHFVASLEHLAGLI
ncbi:SRPBCC family protein [Aeromicrobium terrae]|uniref:Polyketide cyclase n=1 Tax=Aeromicrobium terrae TaxID=2498846 RepID=A0A5C8NI68_9ACTN|nr:SRPBCC family protein [Aeromicrobium terrae]TXL60850.1 polyketide cyclase [Aeromicrobium terrae]